MSSRCKIIGLALLSLSLGGCVVIDEPLYDDVYVEEVYIEEEVYVEDVYVEEEVYVEEVYVEEEVIL